MKALNKADLIFVTSNSLVSRLIRWGSTNKNNPRALVSHVAGVVYPTIGGIVEANIAGVQITNLMHRYADSGHKVAIYRAKNIPDIVKELMTQEALRRVGKRYGFASIVQHLIDHKIFGGKLVARRLNIPDSEICSELWGSICSFFGYDFDRNITPDAMLDFCINNPDKYEEVMPLGELKK